MITILRLDKDDTQRKKNIWCNYNNEKFFLNSYIAISNANKTRINIKNTSIKIIKYYVLIISEQKLFQRWTYSIQEKQLNLYTPNFDKKLLILHFKSY